MQRKINRIKEVKINLNKILLSFVLFLACFFQTFYTEIYAEELELNSEKYILYNMNDNEVILSKDENKKAYIASLTKIMTVLVAIENIDDYDKKVTITYDMLRDIDWDVTVVGFKTGEKVTYDDLLYGAMISSGADAVNALAISISGSKSKFIELMNNKVKELNLKNTHFANVVGLFDEENYSTAYDVSQILIYALKNEKFKEVFTPQDYTLTNGKKITSTIKHYNKTLNQDISFITGAKTGFINAAGYCLATTATLNNVDYLLVTLNAYNNSSAHISDHVKIYNYFNENYGYKTIVDNDDVVVTLKTKYAKEKEIGIHANVKLQEYLKNDFDKSKIKYDYKGLNEISYFTKKGTNLGKITINYEDKKLNEFDLIYEETLKFSILSFLWIKKWYVIITILVLLLFLRAYKVSKARKRRKRKRIA